MYQAETVIAKADEHYEQSYELDRESDREDLKEQQIAFAEWIPKNKFVHIFKNDGSLVWVDGDPKFPSKIRTTSELYELFLTETKQQ